MTGTLNVSNLGKSYRRWGSEWRRIASWFSSRIAPTDEHWTLRGVGFSVESGETVGIVGQNGAGKSTLLKLITGITRPTEGQVHVSGTVAAILELGMGFNPELSGRENALHAAGLMGHSAAAIAAAMPDIEAFAEIGDYFAEPMRTYSTGMQMRLAFSVATAFSPDLLIVDEALSVGDTYFQHKSFDKIRQFKDQGVSILIVTHSMADVRILCDRVILLDRGQILKDGSPDEVVDYYNAMIADRENARAAVQQKRDDSGWLVTRSGTGEAHIEMLELRSVDSGKQLFVAEVGEDVELVLRARINRAIPRLVLGYMIRDKQGHVVWGSNTWHTQQVLEDLDAGDAITFRLSFTCRLGPGSYSVTPALVSTDTHLIDNYEWIDNMLVFEVVNAAHHTFIGTNWLNARFLITRAAS